MNNKIGIIGFGTVGTVLAGLFNTSGLPFMVYDILLEDEALKDSVIKKAEKHNAPVATLTGLFNECSYIISAVTTQVAESVAKKCLPYLKEGQFYIDCNSTSPGIKINISRIIQSGKGDFIEGVILNAVNPGDKTLQMLVGGEKGEVIAELLQQANIKARFYDKETGKASMFKMLRSIFSKGVEVLLLEMLVAAKKAGIEENLWKEITTFMDSKSFEEIGETWMKSHGTAYERRYYEMEQVIDTMKELQVKPILTEATVSYFKQSMDLDLKASFNGSPANGSEVVKAIADRSKL